MQAAFDVLADMLVETAAMTFRLFQQADTTDVRRHLRGFELQKQCIQCAEVVHALSLSHAVSCRIVNLRPSYSGMF